MEPVKIGDKFNKLTVIGTAEKRRYQRMWLCRCDCGTEKVIAENYLISGNTKSCGCWRAHIARVNGAVQKKEKPRRETNEYRIYRNMLWRCMDPTCPAYSSYGGRGIKVFDGWLNDFDAFLAYVGQRPSKNHQLDRHPDMNGNYEPGNVRWATAKENQNNKRNNRRITAFGRTQNVTQWSEEFGIPAITLFARLNRGIDIEKAISSPVDTSRRNRYAGTARA